MKYFLKNNFCRKFSQNVPILQEHYHAIFENLLIHFVSMRNNVNWLLIEACPSICRGKSDFNGIASSECALQILRWNFIDIVHTRVHFKSDSVGGESFSEMANTLTRWCTTLGSSIYHYICVPLVRPGN